MPYLLLTSLKVCDWSGRIVGASASPRSWTTKAGYVGLFHCSWRSAWYQTYNIRVANACGIRGWRNLGFYAWTSSYIFYFPSLPSLFRFRLEHLLFHPVFFLWWVLCCLLGFGFFCCESFSIYHDMYPDTYVRWSQFYTGIFLSEVYDLFQLLFFLRMVRARKFVHFGFSF